MVDHVGMETGWDQLGFLLNNDGRLGRIVWCVHNTSLYRAAPEHIRPATTREMFLHEVHSANPLPSQQEQVLQNGQVPDGVWTDLLDQDRPPAEAVERAEGNELNKDAPGEQVPRKRTRIKAKTYETAAQLEPDEVVFTILEEKNHESWQRLHQQQKLKRQREHSHVAKQVVDQEIMAARVSIPVFEEEATDMDEAKGRELAEWIQEETTSKVREGPDSCPCVGF